MGRDEIEIQIGARVRYLRKKIGITQQALASRCGLHRTYIAGIEGGGRNVTLRSLAKLAAGLEVPIEKLLHD